MYVKGLSECGQEGLSMGPQATGATGFLSVRGVRRPKKKRRAELKKRKRPSGKFGFSPLFVSGDVSSRMHPNLSEYEWDESLGGWKKKLKKAVKKVSKVAVKAVKMPYKQIISAAKVATGVAGRFLPGQSGGGEVVEEEAPSFGVQPQETPEPVYEEPVYQAPRRFRRPAPYGSRASYSRQQYYRAPNLSAYEWDNRIGGLNLKKIVKKVAKPVSKAVKQVAKVAVKPAAIIAASSLKAVGLKSVADKAGKAVGLTEAERKLTSIGGKAIQAAGAVVGAVVAAPVVAAGASAAAGAVGSAVGAVGSGAGAIGSKIALGAKFVAGKFGTGGLLKTVGGAVSGLLKKKEAPVQAEVSVPEESVPVYDPKTKAEGFVLPAGFEDARIRLQKLKAAGEKVAGGLLQKEPESAQEAPPPPAHAYPPPPAFMPSYGAGGGSSGGGADIPASETEAVREAAAQEENKIDIGKALAVGLPIAALLLK